MYEPDATDRRIMHLLQQNCALTHKEIAAETGLTTTPVYERIKRLEREGFISGYVALLNPEKVGRSLTVFCLVSLKEHAKSLLEKFVEEVLRFEEVMECYHIAGNYDYLLKVAVKDMEAYRHFIVNNLAAMNNVAHAHSSFVMTTEKHSTALPV
ncbi:Lrp/AsnC family transcriptional regulator [Sphingobacteriales bacterium UPWRP_1]|nr:AsnC family transcriptional regulator [Sphingobacteriales bacterium TSM_CSM]PSJ74311.1 Lrp/AsnC family transcriptional regulator [Sphingobacteriales bacterium UPWRP_1]